MSDFDVRYNYYRRLLRNWHLAEESRLFPTANRVLAAAEQVYLDLVDDYPTQMGRAGAHLREKA